MKNVISFIKKFTDVTRFLCYQHNIFYALLPLLYFYSNFVDILIVYFTFLFWYMSAFMINDYGDVDTDKIAKKNSVYLGIISRKNLLLLSLTCLIISYMISLYFYPIKAFLFLLLMTFLSYSYSAEPFRLKKKSILGFPVVVFTAGPAGLIYTYISYGFIDYFWLTIMGIISFLHIGQTQIWGGLNDFEADKKVGMFNRFEQKLGKKRSFSLLIWLERVLLLILLIAFLFYNKLISFVFLFITSCVYFLGKISLSKNNKKKFMFLSFPVFSIIISVSLLIFCLF
jgi:4-hydroxybenzoate polyprenyltransferase